MYAVDTTRSRTVQRRIDLKTVSRTQSWSNSEETRVVIRSSQV